MIIAGKFNFVSRLVVANNFIAAVVNVGRTLTYNFGAVIGYAVIGYCFNAVINICNAVVGVGISAVVHVSVANAAANAGVANAAADTALEENRTVNIFKIVAIRASVAVIGYRIIIRAVVGVGERIINAVIDTAVVGIRAIVGIGIVDAVIGVISIGVFNAVVLLKVITAAVGIIGPVAVVNAVVNSVILLKVITSAVGIRRFVTVVDAVVLLKVIAAAVGIIRP